MSIKIVSDSSSNVFCVEGLNYATVPMKIITDEKEYLDSPELDLQGMVSDLQKYKGKSGTSCPNVQDWLDAFGDEDDIFGVTISKNLSGSYNAAQQAAQTYMEEHPGKRAFIFDSQSAGPEQAMIVDKIKELMDKGLDYDTIREQVLDYYNHTHIIFSLESMNNLARNGRVNPAVAKIAGVLGIRVCGDAKGGQITPVHKPRGEKKALTTLVDMMVERGLYDGALVRVAHCFGLETAEKLRELVLSRFPNCRFLIEKTTALCSFYAEAGGQMIAFEGGFNTHNNNKGL